MTLLGIIYFAFSSFCISVGLSVYFSRPRIKARYLFLFLNISTSYMLFTMGGFYQSVHLGEAIFWWKLSSHWPVNVVASYHFLSIYISQDERVNSRIRIVLLYVISIIFSFTDLCTSYIFIIKPGDFGWEVYSPINIVSVLCRLWNFFIITLYIFSVFKSLLFANTKARRNQVLLVFVFTLFLCLSYIADALSFFPPDVYVLPLFYPIFIYLPILIGRTFLVKDLFSNSIRQDICKVCGSLVVSVDFREEICIRCMLDRIIEMEDKVRYLIKSMDDISFYR